MIDDLLLFSLVRALSTKELLSSVSCRPARMCCYSITLKRRLSRMLTTRKWGDLLPSNLYTRNQDITKQQEKHQKDE